MPVIDPPVPAEPVPVTVRPPLEPVLISTIPWLPPFAVIDWKFRPLEPIVVFSTSRAVPVDVARVLAEPVTFTVPPPVATKALLVPVDAVAPPVRLIGPPALV